MAIASKWRYVLELDGQPLELPEGEILLGRSRSCTVTLPDPSISRQHAKLILREGQVRLRDLNSSNGTFVNDTRVQSESAVADGDRIVLGETEMRFHSSAPDGVGALTQRVETMPGEAPSTDEIAAASAETNPAPPPSLEWPPAVTTPPATSRANSKAPTDEMLPSIDDMGPKPAPLPRGGANRVAVAASAGRRPAGFWIRVAAVLLDGVWIGLLAGAAAALPFLLDVPASLASALTIAVGLGSAAVFVIGWARWGTTPGKRLLGLHVCPLGGAPGVGLGKALLRGFGYILSGALLGVGFLLVAFSKDKRGLHDLLAGTSVVRR